MTSLRLQDFSGLIPRRSARLLPDTAATVADNTKLLSGELRGFTETEEIADFTAESFTVRRAIRVPYDDYGTMEDAWLLFDSREVDVVRSPIIDDQYGRYYWAGDGTPKYSTTSRIAAGQDPYLLGVPAPDNAPTVTPPAGSDLTRAYVYTFVTEFGEEGPPSDPTLATGDAGTWALSNLDTTVPDSSDRAVTKKYIYRTVSGSSQTLYYFVGEVGIATTTYNDTSADDDVASNNTLESTSFRAPPEDMEGFVVMPGGYLVGWAGRRLLFSEPYRPHAWPPEYELATEFEIVALAVWGATLVIGTESQPYIGQGQAPASFTLQKLGTVDPCLSRRGMVATVAGVYYPSINGLTLVNTNGVTNVTQDLLTKQEWSQYNPEQIYASQLGLQYVGFHDEDSGFMFNPSEAQARLINLTSFLDVVGIETDSYTGNLYLIQNDKAMEWDPENGFPVDWRWKSKQFQFRKPLNFGAFRVDFAIDTINAGDAFSAIWIPYNNERFADNPLSTINGGMINGGGQNPGTVTGEGAGLPEWRNPLGGSAIVPVGLASSISPYVRVRVFADDVLKYDRVITSQSVFRLPAGFKKDRWQFEMISNSTVFSLAVAEHAKELEQV